MVKRLVELSGIPYQTIYWELAQAFHAPRYDEIGRASTPLCVSGLSGVWRPSNDPAECVILARRLYRHPDNPKRFSKRFWYRKRCLFGQTPLLCNSYKLPCGSFDLYI